MFISILYGNIYAQELGVYTEEVVKIVVKEQQEFKYLVKFKPLATVASVVLFNAFNFEMAFVPYVHPKIGIPIELQLANVGGIFCVVLMGGIEAVPLTHREKSGFYLNYEIGGLHLSTGHTGICTSGHIGYQLVAKRGFVFTPAIGLNYDTVTEEVRPHLMLDIGFALRKK